MERALVLDGNRLSKMSANSKYFFPLPGSTFFKGLAESGAEWRIGWTNWNGMASIASSEKTGTLKAHNILIGLTDLKQVTETK